MGKPMGLSVWTYPSAIAHHQSIQSGASIRQNLLTSSSAAFSNTPDGCTCGFCSNVMARATQGHPWPQILDLWDYPSISQPPAGEHLVKSSLQVAGPRSSPSGEAVRHGNQGWDDRNWRFSESKKFRFHLNFWWNNRMDQAPVFLSHKS